MEILHQYLVLRGYKPQLLLIRQYYVIKKQKHFLYETAPNSYASLIAGVIK
jgi:hypothetical protein